MAIIKNFLTKPFEENIKTHLPAGYGNGKSNKGYAITYVKSEHYIRRINESFDYMVSAEVVEVFEREDPVKKTVFLILHLRMTAYPEKGISIIKEDFGGSPLRWKTQEGPKAKDYIDAYKTAFTDAYKRCCRQFGIGAEIACDPEPGFEYAESHAESHAEPRLEDMPTQAQWAKIASLSGINPKNSEKEKGRFMSYIEALSKRYFSISWKNISRQQADELIRRLEKGKKSAPSIQT